METKKRNIVVEASYREQKVTFDGRLIDVIAQSARLTKADAGRASNERVEDTFTISQDTENCKSDKECPVLTAGMFTKNVKLS